ncbi:MAG: nucleotidyltransferase family protein [Chitinophagaceae bacterium]|nr:MAG: nucleotidyltransferase family protein [Chitinophagaceae bacterium]
MKAMIFSAGLGTRFKPWTDKHPKALAVINGKSLLQRNIEYLQQYGIGDVIVNVHHFPGQIIATLEENKGFGSNIQISDESSEVLETGGGLLKAKHLLNKDEDFLTLNVDILTSLDLHQFISFHRRQQSLVSLAVSNRKSSRCFVFNEENRLTGWRNLQTGEEKIKVIAQQEFNKSFSGISVFSYSFFEQLALQGKFSLVDAYLSLAAANPIYGFDHSGDKWVDVGRLESVPTAEALFI